MVYYLARRFGLVARSGRGPATGRHREEVQPWACCAEASPWSRLDAVAFAGSGGSSAALWIDDIQFLAGTQ